MKVLALDLSSKTGWAHTCGQSGVWNFKIKSDESKDMRLIRLRGKITEIYQSVGINLIVFESANYSGTNRNSLPDELISVVKTWCLDRSNIEYKGYPSSEIKKHATGKGNANKDAMVKAAREKFEIDIIDDNHADALWLLDLAKKDLVLQ